jgi:3-demethoxyubiquinol 3-hydroxylase
MRRTEATTMVRNTTALDRIFAGLGRALAAVSAAPGASRPTPRPAPDLPAASLSARERRLSGALMRVNHVGEVCAQALYEGQAATTSDERLERFFRAAAAEEGDHLAWTRQRLDELGASPSLLNPLWYAGAFAMGAVASRMGDRFSLGFMVETERQVEAHLDGHLRRLPAGDTASRAIVDRMKRDEAQHADSAQHLGAAPMPAPVQAAMRAAAKVMTGTAHYI